MVEWQKKGYVLKVRRGYYCFKECEKDEQFLFFTANKIYGPSYVSFEGSLAYHNLIPEGVFLTTSVTTGNTANFNTPVGHFIYRHMKSALFFGYGLIQSDNFTFKIAEPEKSMLDYLYLNRIDTIDEMAELRINEILVREIIDFGKLKKYQAVFDSKVLNKRIQLFKKLINA